MRWYYGLPAAKELNFGKQETTVSGPSLCGERQVWAEGQRDFVLWGVRAAGQKVLPRRRERKERSCCRACVPLGMRRQRSDAKAAVVFGEVLLLLCGTHGVQRDTGDFLDFSRCHSGCQAGRAVTLSQSSC